MEKIVLMGSHLTYDESKCPKMADADLALQWHSISFFQSNSSGFFLYSAL
jgi:hypothetical protein